MPDDGVVTCLLRQGISLHLWIVFWCFGFLLAGGKDNPVLVLDKAAFVASGMDLHDSCRFQEDVEHLALLAWHGNAQRSVGNKFWWVKCSFVRGSCSGLHAGFRTEAQSIPKMPHWLSGTGRHKTCAELLSKRIAGTGRILRGQ